MKKLLSFVLVAMMVLSCIVPSLAVPAESIPAEDDGISYCWLDDGVLDPETNQVTISIHIVNRGEKGFQACEFAIYFPKCLKIVDHAYGTMSSSASLTFGKMNEEYTRYMTQYALDAPGNAEIIEKYGISVPTKKDYAAGERGDWYCYVHGFAYDAGGDEYEVYQNTYESGTTEVITFQYVPEEYPEIAARYTDKIPVIALTDTSEPDGLFLDYYTCDSEETHGYIYAPDREKLPAENFITIPSTGCNHEVERANVVDATCTEAGSYDEVCKLCGETISTGNVIPPKGHTPGEAEIVDSTCTEAGVKTVKCTVCGETISTEAIDPKGHTAGEPVVTGPTCTEDGTTKIYCTVCNALLSEEPTPGGGATGHKAGEPVVVPSTCSVAGTSKTYCTVCNELLESVELPLADHTTVKKVLEASTSSKAGKWQYYCTTCKQLVGDVQELPVLDKFVMSVDDVTVNTGETVTIPVNVKIPATGLWGTRIFGVWEKELGADAVAFENGEILREFEASAALDITAADKTDYFDYYSVDFGKNIDDYYKSILMCAPVGDDQSNVNGEGALYTMTIKAPTTPGTYSFGYVIVDDIIANIWEADGNVYNYDTDSRIAWATLTVVCPHEAGEPEIVDATCTEAGSKTVKCTLCGEVLSTEVIEPKGHIAGEPVIVDATCTEAGSKTVKCTVCGEVLSTEVINPKGHTPGEWETVKEATETETGLKELRCTVCGELIDSEVIPVIVKVLDLKFEAGYFTDVAASGIDNETRTITLVSKVNAPENDYRIIFPADGYTATVADANVDVIAGRYNRSYAKNGDAQSYQITINDGEKDYIYTVNVTFVPAPACSGVEPGYFADTTYTGFDPENDHVINVVSKEGAPEVDFRMINLAAGAYPVVNADIEGTVQEIQWVGSVEEGGYTDVRGSADRAATAWTYFRSIRTNGLTQSYTIDVVRTNGTAETYTVNVTFR